MRRHSAFFNDILCHNLCHEYLSDPGEAGVIHYNNDSWVVLVQLVLQAAAQYASPNAALENSVSTPRAITGGTGKYANAQGWVETNHLPNGSWQHILHLK